MTQPGFFQAPTDEPKLDVVAGRAHLVERLDQEVAAAVPNYEEIDRDPRWHQWLLGIDPLNGRMRQELLNAAIAARNAWRVAAFFNGFLGLHAVDGGRAPGRRGPAQIDANKSYTRSQIKALYEQHRKGTLVGDRWDQIERDIIRAGAEGRVIGTEDPHSK